MGGGSNIGLEDVLGRLSDRIRLVDFFRPGGMTGSYSITISL